MTKRPKELSLLCTRDGQSLKVQHSMDWEGRDSVAYLAIRGSQVWLNKKDTETLVKYLLELLAFPSFYNNFHRDAKNPNKPYVL